MQTIKYPDILLPKNLDILRAVIQKHGIIIYPTDTLYGLGGNFFSSRVIEKIDRIKGRKDMPYSAAVSGIEMLNKLVETIPAVFYDLHKKLLPGKFTFLFKACSSINKALLKNSDKIGIRIPNVPDILKLIEILDVPLVSTSVNPSGELPLNDPAAIRDLFSNEHLKGFLSLLIDKGPLPESGGSTILDLTVTPIQCIRKGDDFSQLKRLDIAIGVMECWSIA